MGRSYPNPTRNGKLLSPPPISSLPNTNQPGGKEWDSPLGPRRGGRTLTTCSVLSCVAISEQGGELSISGEVIFPMGGGFGRSGGGSRAGDGNTASWGHILAFAFFLCLDWVGLGVEIVNVLTSGPSRSELPGQTSSHSRE